MAKRQDFLACDTRETEPVKVSDSVSWHLVAIVLHDQPHLHTADTKWYFCPPCYENCTIKDMSVVKPYSKNRGRKVRKDIQFVLNTNFSLFIWNRKIEFWLQTTWVSGESDQHILSSRSRPSRVPQLTCIWMSLPGASGLGKLTSLNHPYQDSNDNKKIYR